MKGDIKMKLTTKQKLQVAKNIAIEIPIEILQFLVVPIALLFCNKDSENLPDRRAHV